jgi:iron complex outermembrane recepter protein
MRTGPTGMAFLMFAAGAIASEPPPEPLSEIIVTARTVPESLALVPLAIDVIDGGRIGSGSVESLATLALQVPGLSFQSLWGGSGAAPILRGQSQPSTAGDNVGVFVDDVYQVNHSALDIMPLDLARIEVVRGPQNTLLGRSTFAGAIRYVSQQPTEAFSGRLQAEIGSDSLAGIQGAWSRRIFDSHWLGRIAIAQRQADGTRKSSSGESLGDFRQQSAALNLVRESADRDINAVELRARINQGHFGHPASFTLGAASFNCGGTYAVSGPWTYFCGSMPVVDRFSLSRGLTDSQSGSTQVALRLARPLGDLTLRSLTSYYDASATIYRDFDGSATGLGQGVCTIGVNCPVGNQFTVVTRFASPNVVSRTQQYATDWTQELRLGRDDTAGMRWMIGVAASWTRGTDKGAFGADREDLQPDERLTAIVASTPSRVGGPSRLNSALVQDSRQQQVPQSESRSSSDILAAFGMIDVPVSGRSRARLELRLERERLHVDSVLANFQPDTSAELPALAYTQPLPRFSVDMRFDHAWYGWASLARGARSGGVNTIPGLDESEQGYEPEHNWTGELGLRFGGGVLVESWQLTLYRIDWTNTQITGVATTPGIGNLIVTNTAGLTTHGVESQLNLRFNDTWTSSIAASWTNPRFDRGSDDAGSRVFCGLTLQPPGSSFCDYGPPRTENNGTLGLVPYLDDNHAARTPRHSLGIGVRAMPRVNVLGWRLGAEASFAWQDDMFERPINGASYGSRQLLSARAMLERGPWHLELWGSNLTNDNYVRAAGSRGNVFYPSSPRPLDLLYPDGRRLGLALRLDLGAN